MTKALVIDASSRGNSSLTRAMTQQFISHYQKVVDKESLQYRDLQKVLVPHLTAEMIEGFFSPEPSARAKRATVLSDQLIDELLEADLICFGVPVYNFNMPSSLKAYIDQVVRIGRTFRKNGDGQLEGLCQGKRAIVLYAMGGMFAGSEMDLIQPYFNILSEFMGFDLVEFVNVQGTSRSGFNREQQLEFAREQIEQFIESNTVYEQLV